MSDERDDGFVGFGRPSPTAYNNRGYLETSENLGKSSAARLPLEMDTTARNNFFMFIKEECDSAIKKAERIREMKLRILASHEDVTTELIKVLLGEQG